MFETLLLIGKAQYIGKSFDVISIYASRMTYEDKSDAYGNFTFSKEIGYNKQP
ncbi:MAG: hypothetical protein J7K81_00805 [Methanophagales archaeon]|nr:hypothetical protein [Methanophagales archaeon]